MKGKLIKGLDVNRIFVMEMKRLSQMQYSASVRLIFDRALAKVILAQDSEDDTIDKREGLLATLADFCLGEYLYLQDISEKELNEERIEILADRAAKKFFVFEDKEHEASLMDSLPFYDVRVSALRYAILNLEEINSPLSKKNFNVSLINDIFETTFRKIDGFARMMMLGLYPDALAAWRTLHESECFIKLLITGGDRVRYAYIDHIYFSNAYVFKDNFTTEQLDQTFAELKERMAEHNLKSKDMKKFIDYGWLYEHPSYDPEDKLFKLNFRDGVERLAGMRNEETNEVYGFTSEITHSSAIFYYANDELCKNLALTYTYQTVIHIVELYLEYMSNYFRHNKSQADRVNEDLDSLKEISDYLMKTYMKLNENEGGDEYVQENE